MAAGDLVGGGGVRGSRRVSELGKGSEAARCEG